MTGYYEIVNWREYQHYTKRNPSWIKLHHSILTSRTWITADDTTRSLMIAIMLVAANTQNKIPDDPDYLKRVAYLNHDPDFTHLLDTEFIRYVDNCDSLLATPSYIETDARPETETETETEIETEKRQRGSGGDEKSDDHLSAILAHQESHSLLSTYSSEQQRVIRMALDEVASTRQRGIIADSVRCSILRKLSRFPKAVVEQATRMYISKGCAKEGKDEKYWIGIVRGMWKRDRKDAEKKKRAKDMDSSSEWIHGDHKYSRRDMELMAFDVHESVGRKIYDQEKLDLVKTAMRERPQWNWPEGLG